MAEGEGASRNRDFPLPPPRMYGRSLAYGPARMSPTSEARYSYYIAEPATRLGISEPDYLYLLLLEALDVPHYRANDRAWRTHLIYDID